MSALVELRPTSLRGRALTVLEHAQLGLWREIFGRWPLWLVLPACMVVFQLTPLHPEMHGGLVLFLLAAAAPLVICLAAGRFGLGDDRWWRGLGTAASLGQLLGRTVAHAVLVGIPVAALAARTSAELLLGPSAAGVAMLLLGALYASTAAARALSGQALASLLGPLVVAGCLAAVTTVSSWLFGWWPHLDGFVWRTAVFAGASVIALVTWELRWGGWGGSVARRAVLASAACLLLASASLLAELIWPFRFLF